MMSELFKTSKVNLTARGLSQVENFLADTDFSVSTSFSDLRSITKLYLGEKPQNDSCCLDLAGSAVHKTIKNIFATSTIKKVKQILSSDNCTKGNDPDNHVYEILSDFLTTPEFAGKISETSAEY